MNKNFDPNKLKIVDFRITNGVIDAPFEFEVSSVDNYETNMSFDASFDVDTCSVRADMGFEIVTSSKQQQGEAKASFNFIFIYEVENLPELVELVDGKIDEISDNLMVSVASISFSTSRGVLLTRLQGTAMKDYILPVIKPEELLSE